VTRRASFARKAGVLRAVLKVQTMPRIRALSRVSVRTWRRQISSSPRYRTDQAAVITWILEHAGAEADEINIVSL
jgi:hypothetical protein